MPSPSIKTIRELIFYQYAKIIASSAGICKVEGGSVGYYSFVIDRVNKFKKGEINMSSITRELKMQMKSDDKKCEYCGEGTELSWDHIIPQSKGGPDTAENLVLCCKKCNSSKKDRGLYAWYGLKAKDNLPRLVVGKYLKLLYDLHEQRGTLNSSKSNGKLTVLDLESF